jgi:hypothetical protein
MLMMHSIVRTAVAVLAIGCGAHAVSQPVQVFNEDPREAIGFVLENAPLKPGGTVALAVRDTDCVVSGKVDHRTDATGQFQMTVRLTSMECKFRGGRQEKFARELDVKPGMVQMPHMLVRGMGIPLGVPLAMFKQLKKVVLEETIQASAEPGETVTLRDADCRYVGRLAHDPAKNSRLQSKAAAVRGADTGKWYVAVETRICNEGVEEVKFRVDLPEAPSFAGFRGTFSGPTGFQAGTQFSISVN